MKIIKKLKAYNNYKKIIQTSLNYINDELKFIAFLNKNNFSLSVKNDLPVFYKYAIYDNTLLIFEDEDEIKNYLLQEFTTAFDKKINKFDIDIASYYQLKIDICGYSLLKYNQNINRLSNEEEFSIDKIKTLLDKNLIETAKSNEKSDISNNVAEYYLYKVEYSLIKSDEFLNLRKFYRKFTLFSSILIVLIILITILIIKK